MGFALYGNPPIKPLFLACSCCARPNGTSYRLCWMCRTGIAVEYAQRVEQDALSGRWSCEVRDAEGAVRYVSVGHLTADAAHGAAETWVQQETAFRQGGK